MKEKLTRMVMLEYKRLKSWDKLGKEIGMPPTTLWRVITGSRGGRMDTWEKISDWAENKRRGE